MEMNIKQSRLVKASLKEEEKIKYKLFRCIKITGFPLNSKSYFCE